MLFFSILRKIILKTIVLFSLVGLTLFNSVLKIAIFLFGLLAVPVATFTVIATCIMGFMNGFHADMSIFFGAAVILISLKYLLPLLPKSLDIAKFNMKEYLYQPIIVRSPVKYTI